jgi:hypothetical protein
MSNLRIGLVVEGPTDAIVLKAGLAAFLNDPFIASTLQPEIPPDKKGAGWGGVFWWCRQMAALGSPSLEQHPTLDHFDLVVIQVDADVAGFNYHDANIQAWHLNDLPCEFPCPPASDTVNALCDVICGWLSPSDPGAKSIICIPSKCIETWVAAALYARADSGLATDLECSYEITAYLHAKPARSRLIRMHDGRPRKIKTRYLAIEPNIKRHWKDVCHFCPEAKKFQSAVKNAIALNA